MESVIGSMLGSYEQGMISRRQFVEGVSPLAAGAPLPPSAPAEAPAAPIVPVSVNHIAFGVSDLQRSKD